MKQDDSWPRACFIPQRVVSSPRFQRSFSIGVYLPHPLNHGYFMVEPAHFCGNGPSQPHYKNHQKSTNSVDCEGSSF